MKFDKTMEEVKAAIDAADGTVILDVRRDDEYKEGHLPTAISIPLDQLKEKVTFAKDRILYVYCRSGQRSMTACRILKEAGYENVYNVGGIIYWPYEIEQ